MLGQLGTDDATASKLPKGYFDMVVSVSVLEEIGDASIVTKIASHSNELLAENGVFANTHDINYGDTPRLRFYFDCLLRAGFFVGDIEDVLQRIFSTPIQMALLENPTQAMTCYNQGGDDRVYSGHWTTLFHVSGPSPH